MAFAIENLMEAIVPRKSDARGKMIRAAAELFQRQGYHGTGMAEILERSGAPKGSIYHHFPQGKEQIALEAVAHAGREIRALVAKCFANSGDSNEAFGCLAGSLATWFDTATNGTGCPIAAVLLDTSDASPALRDACGAAFRSWAYEVEMAALSWGYSSSDAAFLANATVMNMEGAWLMARATASSEPFQNAARICSVAARHR